jgi:hypothetical protein
MLSEVSQAQKHKRHVFSLMSKIDPKVNIDIKIKHDHIQTQMQNMFVTVELLYGTQGKRERKENDRASVISHTIIM